jgi:hypothetical protein
MHFVKGAKSKKKKEVHMAHAQRGERARPSLALSIFQTLH